MTDKIETGLLLDYYGSMLTERQRDVLRFYCDMDFSLSEVADEFGITRQAALDLVARATDKLYTYEQKLGLVNKVLDDRKVYVGFQKSDTDLTHGRFNLKIGQLRLVS